MLELSRSVHFDWRLAPYEIEVNLVHLNNLMKQKIVSKSDGEILEKGLLELAGEIGSGKFTYNND
jgi:argininosuccinate lyase